MGYITKIPIFTFVLLSLWYVGLFCYFNQTIVRVEIPYLGIFNLASALGFLLSFLAGCAFSAIFFGIDSIRKSFLLRKSRKKLELLERQTSDQTTRFPSSDSDSLDHDMSTY